MRRLHCSSRCARRRGATSRGLHVQVQPTSFVRADVDNARNVKDSEFVETTMRRLYKDRQSSMFDPPLDPQHEIFQVGRFWEELQKQVSEWKERIVLLERLRSAKELTASEYEVVAKAHLYGDKLIKFFTHMRAHLDRNPRDRLAFYKTRPDDLTDVFGVLMQVVASQVDFDYCPRCHIRLDGHVALCGDPAVLNDMLYGDNHVFGFEGSETEHSFWTPSWLGEYEERVKQLWYQSLQLPFFRTPTHTALQCEAMMEMYERTLNRGEANHFMRQCQIHSLPITPKMVQSMETILQNTNPHSVFAHGDPAAVSPRWLRYNVELSKAKEMAEKGGGMKRLPPSSYRPFTQGEELYASIPNKFTLDERNWVKDFKEVGRLLQESVDDWCPIQSQRSQSSEFPDHAYDEETLSIIRHWRQRRDAQKLRTTPVPLKSKKASAIPNLRCHVHGRFDIVPAEPLPVAEPGKTIVFPTSRNYEAFDITPEGFEAFCLALPKSADSKLLMSSLRPGARIRAETLRQYVDPGALSTRVLYPLRDKDGERLAEFHTDPHVMMAGIEVGSHLGLPDTSSNESIRAWNAKVEEWRRTLRPWCEGLWNSRFTKLQWVPRPGTRLVKGDEVVYVVGLHAGELWGVTPGSSVADVRLGHSYNTLMKYSCRGEADPWMVQSPVECEGVVVGIKEGELYVQWGPTHVATCVGKPAEFMKNFRKLVALPGDAQPVEPPHWNIPFRNNWAAEELAEALRRPWDQQPLVAEGPYEAPLLPLELHDPECYKLDDHRTKEYENRVKARNLLNGSALPYSSAYLHDDSIFSVNVQGSAKIHTGYGQPQVDRDELTMSLAPEDGKGDEVPDWEIDEMEQALRDISGRAPGAAAPRVDTLNPDAQVADMMDIRRRSRLQLSRYGTTLLNPNNPQRKELDALTSGQVTKSLTGVADQHAWEHGGLRDVGHLSAMEHQQKSLLGNDPHLALHKKFHFTGREAEQMRLNPAQEYTVKAFRAMHEYYNDLSKPYDVGHGFESTDMVVGIDQFTPPDHKRKTMAVGEKRRLAALLQRLWMQKAEKERLTLDGFARTYKLHRHMVLAWFGGDGPATPTLLAALRSYLYFELKELNLLDDLTPEDADTYSPVHEPGFYKWLDKSQFEHQYELLTHAKLYRFDSKYNIELSDPLQTRLDKAARMDTSEIEDLQKYNDMLAGGNADIMKSVELDEYDSRIKKVQPRVSVNINTNQPGVNIVDAQHNIGFPKESIQERLVGTLSLTALRKMVQNTLSHKHGLIPSTDNAAENINRLLRGGHDETGPPLMDARMALSFARHFHEQKAMDLLYCIRRNKSNQVMRREFEDFMDLNDEAKKAEERLEGLYTHSSGSFRIFKREDEKLIIENASQLDSWHGTLEKIGEEDGKATYKSYVEGGYVVLLRHSNGHEVEWAFGTEETIEGTAPETAVAARADLDLKTTLWEQYVEGLWVIGSDEAKKLVERWVQRNVDKVVWKAVIPKEGRAPTYLPTLLAAASSAEGVSRTEGGVVRVQSGAVQRAVRLEGSLSSLKLHEAEQLMPGLPGVTQEGQNFSIEYIEEAVKVVREADPRSRPFTFENASIEHAAAKAKWERLEMGIEECKVVVNKRQDIPPYGELLELYHWLDTLLGMVDQNMEAIASKAKLVPEEALNYARAGISFPNSEHFRTLLKVQAECVHSVVTYLANKCPGSPFLLGNAGYDANLFKEGQFLPLYKDEETIEGFDAQVLDRQLPLLRWWYNVIMDMKSARDAELAKLQKPTKAQLLEPGRKAVERVSRRTPENFRNRKTRDD